MKKFFKIFFGCNLASLIHLFRLDLAAFFQICTRAFIASRVPSEIPEIELDEILGDRKPLIRMRVERYDEGSLPNHQAMALLSILAAEAPSEVLEIGTYMGHTTRRMAETLPSATIHTVDLPPDFSLENDPQSNMPKGDMHLIKSRVVGREFVGEPCAASIRQHFADTGNWNFKEAGTPTFFFIDGCHTYQYCKNDSEKCLALCEGRGIFLWHDCDVWNTEVTDFIRAWRREGKDIKRIAGTPIAYWKAT